MSVTATSARILNGKHVLKRNHQVVDLITLDEFWT